MYSVTDVWKLTYAEFDPRPKGTYKIWFGKTEESSISRTEDSHEQGEEARVRMDLY